jgi:hypothetical protein
MKNNAKITALILNTLLFGYIASKTDFSQLDAMGGGLCFCHSVHLSIYNIWDINN